MSRLHVRVLDEYQLRASHGCEHDLEVVPPGSDSMHCNHYGGDPDETVGLTSIPTSGTRVAPCDGQFALGLLNVT